MQGEKDDETATPFDEANALLAASQVERRIGFRAR
jgi:hypothetical protein